MRRFAGTGAAALAAFLLLVAAACGEGNKAGGAAEQHVAVLRLVSFNADVDPQLQLFSNDVARESHGSLRVDVVLGYRSHDPRGEKDVISDVRAGRAELAWVGARAWETVGIPSFRALIAPFLIDNYPLEQRVLRSSLAPQMLASLRARGLVGLAVLGGPLRRVAGHRPLLRPTDFAGISFATTANGTARSTVRALGARPVLLRNGIPASALPVGLGGLDSQLHAIAGNEYFRPEPFLTRNLVLWPRPLVLFANAGVYESLSSAQRQVLRRAAHDAVIGSTRAAENQDAADAAELCHGLAAGSGLKVISARAGDLRALRHAVTPVYRKLEQDRQTRSFIEEIQSFKRHLDAPVDSVPRCARAASATGGVDVLDGVYRMHTSEPEAAATEHVPVAEATPENWGDFVLVMNHDRFALTQKNALSCTWQYGKLRVKRKQKKLDWSFTNGGGLAPTNSQNKPGEFFDWRWNLYRRELRLDAVTPPDLSPEMWQKASAIPSAAALSKCPQGEKARRWIGAARATGRAGGARPKQALAGVYEVDTSPGDLRRAVPPDDTPPVPENWGHWVYVFSGNRLAFTQQDKAACTWAYGRVHVHGKILSWKIIDGGYTKSPNRAYNKPGESFRFRWSLYRGLLTLSAVPGAISPTNFRARPWRRISGQPSARFFSKACPPPKAALP
jgi:TRAP-type C4-dicarboxylate transport system substrate-binding protein